MTKQDRLIGLFDKASETGLSRALAQCLEESRSGEKDLATLIAASREVRIGLARLFSSHGSMMSVFRLLVEPDMVGVIKEMVTDKHLPCRKAAAFALSRFKADTSIPFLKSGLQDPNKHVREICGNTLRNLIGEEEFDKTVKEMEAEATSLMDRLKKLSELVHSALSSLGGSAAKIFSQISGSIFDGAKTGASWFSSTAKKIFKHEGEK